MRYERDRSAGCRRAMPSDSGNSFILSSGSQDNQSQPIFARPRLFATEPFEALRRRIEIPIALAGGAVSTVLREAALRLNADLIIIGRGTCAMGWDNYRRTL